MHWLARLADSLACADRMYAATPFGVFQMLPVTAPQAPNAFFTKQDVSAECGFACAREATEQIFPHARARASRKMQLCCAPCSTASYLQRINA
jgi:hypothetical protein